MRRFIVQADDDLIRRVKELAAVRGVPVAQIVREALEAALSGEQRGPSFIGAADSKGRGPAASEIDDKYVADPYATAPFKMTTSARHRKRTLSR